MLPSDQAPRDGDLVVSERSPEFPYWDFEVRAAGAAYVGVATHKSGATISLADVDVDDLLAKLRSAAARAEPLSGA